MSRDFSAVHSFVDFDALRGVDIGLSNETGKYSVVSISRITRSVFSPYTWWSAPHFVLGAGNPGREFNSLQEALDAVREFGPRFSAN
jgi:hypothetical protein